MREQSRANWGCRVLRPVSSHRQLQEESDAPFGGRRWTGETSPSCWVASVDRPPRALPQGQRPEHVRPQRAPPQPAALTPGSFRHGWGRAVAPAATDTAAWEARARAVIGGVPRKARRGVGPPPLNSLLRGHPQPILTLGPPSDGGRIVGPWYPSDESWIRNIFVRQTNTFRMHTRLAVRKVHFRLCLVCLL